MPQSCASGSRSIPRITEARAVGIRKSNRTDNVSATMATGKGVIQGYTGVATVDDRHQIIVEVQAHGAGAGAGAALAHRASDAAAAERGAADHSGCKL